MANKLLTAVLALSCILLGYLLFNTVEVYEESVDAGWTFEAKRNPYLAAEIMLQRFGSHAESSDAKSAIDKLNDFDSLLITSSGLVVNQAMADALLNWVEDGGELVIGADDTRGKLLELLGVEYKAVTYHYAEGEEPIAGDRGWTDQDKLSPMEKALVEYEDDNNKKACKKCEEDKSQSGCEVCAEGDDAVPVAAKKKLSDMLKETNRKNREKELEQANSKSKGLSSSAASGSDPEKIPARRITRLQFNDYNHDVNAVFSPWSIITHPGVNLKTTNKKGEEDKNIELEYTPFYWIGSQQGVHLMQFDIGEGMITVVSDTSIWDNHQLARQDHALLLRTLGFRNTSLILYGVAMPSILKLAWQKFPELIITLSLLIMFCLWKKAIRVGPLEQLNSSGRRSIIDSILGLASYQHKRKKYSRLLQPVIADILLSANRQISGFTGADPEKQQRLISEHTGLSQQILAQALNPEAVQDDNGFQETISLLRKIRKTL